MGAPWFAFCPFLSNAKPPLGGGPRNRGCAQLPCAHSTNGVDECEKPPPPTHPWPFKRRPLLSPRQPHKKTPHIHTQWEIFRCNLYTPTDDCTDKQTTKCISEALYQGQADAMVSEGFAAAG